MSGITPILDTLLHQVLGKRVDTPVIKDQPLPVSAATSSDAIQPARSDSRLHQQTGARESVPLPGNAAGNAPGSPAATGRIDASSTQLHLSHAANEIADILARFPSTQAPSIRPLLSLLVQPGDSPQALAAALSQSVRESGVFYESHLLRWMAGQYPRAALMREPQAWLSLTFRPAFTSSSPSTPSLHDWSLVPRGASRGGAPGMPGVLNGGVAALPDDAPGQASAARLAGATHAMAMSTKGDPDAPASASMTRAHQLSQSPSDMLQSLVRQQLEVIAAPSLRWEGQLLPGVPMVMVLSEIPTNTVRDDDREEAQGRRDQEGEEGGASAWRAEVQVRLPSLGVVDLVFRTRHDASLQVEIAPVEASAREIMEVELSPFRERLSSLGLEVDLALGSRA
ncbi:flagellar hook-length control protein FliK [Salinicola lusitanus]|uniref:flagellar hook-length control protein FliK n=1 Tax=Salinicola lusitanus TaxID=1949085 RepID=UPI000DA1FDB1|nr:flagellar hook-length control protein FliK [Salinicola lusitanus]